MRAQTQLPAVTRQRRLRNAELRAQIGQLEVDLRQARERLHARQLAVHNAVQVLAIARVERYLAAMEVAELADRLECLQGLPRFPPRGQKAAACRRGDD